MRNQPEYKLPKRIDKILGLFALESKRTGDVELAALLGSAECSVNEGITQDSWNGGTTGHAVHLSLPLEKYLSVASRQSELAKEFRDGLNRHSGTPNEHVEEVILEAQDSPEIATWRESVSTHAPAPEPPPETLHRIWAPGMFRLFVSHKDSQKHQAVELKKSLLEVGVTCFVAHEDIEPTRLWQDEIERALSTMHAMTCLLSSDFHASNWTDQEIGFALGRNVPVLPVKLGADPYGFVGRIQAIPGREGEMSALSERLFEYMWGMPSLRNALTDGLITALENSGSFGRSNTLIELLAKLQTATPAQVERLRAVPKSNGQVRDAFRVKALLPTLLERLQSTEIGRR